MFFKFARITERTIMNILSVTMVSTILDAGAKYKLFFSLLNTQDKQVRKKEREKNISNGEKISRDGHRERERDRQTDRQTDRQVDCATHHCTRRIVDLRWDQRGHGPPHSPRKLIE